MRNRLAILLLVMGTVLGIRGWAQPHPGTPDEPAIRERQRQCREHLAKYELHAALEAAKAAWQLAEARYGPDALPTLYAMRQVGEVHNARTDHYQAIQYYIAALNRRRATVEGHDVHLAVFLMELGRAYSRIGENYNSEKYYTVAIDMLDALPDPPDSLRAECYRLHGLSYSYMRLFDKADHWFARAREGFLRAFPPEDLRWAELKYGLGIQAVSVGRVWEGMRYLRESLELQEAVGGHLHPKSAHVRRRLRLVESALGNATAAQAYLHDMLRSLFPGWSPGMAFTDSLLARRVGDPALQRYGLTDLGLAFWSAAKKAPAGSEQYLELCRSAFDAYHAALKLDRQWNAWYYHPTSKLVVLNQYRSVYKPYLEILFALHTHTAEPQWALHAHEWLEKFLNGIGRDKMQNRIGLIEAGVPPEIGERFAALRRADIDAALAHRAKYKNHTPDIYNQKALNGILLNIGMELLRDSLQRHYPDYFRFAHGARLATLEDVRRLLPEDGAYLYYFAFGEQFTMLGISADTVVFRQRADFAPLAQMGREFMDGLSDHDANSVSPARIRRYQELGHALYRELLEPLLRPMDSSIRRLMITATAPGSLQGMPFDALLTDTVPGAKSYAQLPYVLHKYAIHDELSASTLMLQGSDARLPNNGATVAYAPEFSAGEALADKQVALRTLRSAGRTALPGASQEVRILAEHFNGVCYTGAAATKESFLGSAKDAALIHVASHGRGESGWDSRVIFSQLKDSSRHTEFRGSEAEYIGFRADLVVLSACETAKGNNTMEATHSLATGFSIGGCAATLGTRWPVDDHATQELMAYYYPALAAGKPKDVALQEAKQAYLKGRDAVGSHPFFWAAFVGMGDPGPLSLEKKESGAGIWWWAIAAIGLLVAGWMRRTQSGKNNPDK